MQYKKKYLSITIIILIIGVIFFSMNNFFESKDNLIILDQIEFDAVYLENEHMVKVSFKDKTNNTKFAILEILGMDVTYHQEYTFDYDSSFIEEVSLQEIPKYGWKTTPVILEIQHSEFGKISLKIEIHDPSESKPKIIVEQK